MPDPVVAVLEVAEAVPVPVAVEEIVVTFEVPLYVSVYEEIEFIGEAE
jgi:hypothetical protein